MPTLAFVSPTALPRTAAAAARTAHRTAHKRRLPARAPTASLSTDLATAAAVATTVSLSLLPLQTAYPPSAAVTAGAADGAPRSGEPVAHLVVSGGALLDASAAASSADPAARAPLAVVGVAKSAIHDYDVAAAIASASASASARAPAPAYPPADEPDGADEARRELALSARLITAVLTGAVVGVERRATRLNLGVRSVTLLSLTGALAAVCVATTATGAPSALLRLVGAHGLGVAAVAASGLLAGLGLYAATRLRARPTRHARAMSAVVGSTVAMGVACGLGQGLLTAALYLCAVAVMRGNAARVLRDEEARPRALRRDAGGRAYEPDDDGFDLSVRTAAAAAAAAQSDAL